MIVIVGSGATGGWAAKELTQKGLRVAVLEAGRKLDPLQDYTEHTWPYELKFRGFGNPSDMERTQQIWKWDIAPLAGCHSFNVDSYKHSTPGGVVLFIHTF